MRRPSHPAQGRAVGILTDGLRFVIAGVANTSATIALYQALLFLLPASAAYALSWLAGLVFVVLVYPVRVFKQGDASRRARVLMAAVYLVGFCMGLGVVALMTPALGPRAAILPAVVVTTVFNFLAMRLIARPPERRA
jgi:putative flippase GtrA